MMPHLNVSSRLSTQVFRVLGLSLSLPILLSSAPTWAAPLTFGSEWPTQLWPLPRINQTLPLPQRQTNPNSEVQVQTNPTNPGSPSSTQTDPPIPEVEVEDPTASEPRFRCEIVGGQYTVMYYPISQPDQAYPWAVPSEMGGGWTPERRCTEISRRLESYRPDGLKQLQTGIENGYNTICATTEDVPGCRIVLTVPPGDNPELVRDRIFQNLVVADSGQTTQGVYTWVDERSGAEILESVFGNNRSGKRQIRRANSNGIPLRQFLDPADGGTGRRLNRRFFQN